MRVLKNILGIGTVLKHFEVKSDKLPNAFDGFRILHISDFHCAPKKDMLKCIEGEKFDAVIVTGDLTDEKKPYGIYLELLSELIKIAPVYQVSGNHDMYRSDREEFFEKCRELGSVFLQDEVAEIERFGEKIYLLGMSDSGSKKKSKVDAAIEASLSKLKRQDGYEILLYHRANKLDSFRDMGFDLILSGHMHGGHIRLGKLGGVLSPKSGIFDTGRLFFPKYSGGYYKIGKTDAIVNCGLGNSIPIPRFGNPTEIISITLKKI